MSNAGKIVASSMVDIKLIPQKKSILSQKMRSDQAIPKPTQSGVRDRFEGIDGSVPGN